jgi:ATP-dependent Clp protease protease subunit
MQKSASPAADRSVKYERLDDTIDSTLLTHRRLFISRSIDMELAEEVIRKIWFLEYSSPTEGVVLVINSPGGSIDAGFAIWDQLKMMSFPLTTVVTGLAASMGSVLALCAPKERRFATPRSRLLIHQPALGAAVEGQATDLEIQACEILKTKKQIVDLYCEATGKGQAEIEKAIDRDRWMSAEEALQFGLVERLATSYKEIEAL